MSKIVKLGSRSSQLALYQANLIQEKLNQHGIQSELILINSAGDLDTSIPIYEMGIQGVFTKALDIALLNGEIDIAVHSLKDVPTKLAKGLSLEAILDRNNRDDILIHKGKLPTSNEDYCVGTGSLRRKAQWLKKYPHHKIENIRGNIDTRVKKLYHSDTLDAIILAATAVKRLDLNLEFTQQLSWMISAPAQGALGLVGREDDDTSKQYMKLLDDYSSSLTAQIERSFLEKVNGICSMPIAASATLQDNAVHIEACILSVDGKQSCFLDETYNIQEKEIGKKAAEKLLNSGGQAIMDLYR